MRKNKKTIQCFLLKKIRANPFLICVNPCLICFYAFSVCLPSQQQSPPVQSQIGSLLVSQPLMIAAAQPTPGSTSIAFARQFRAQAPHSIQASLVIRAFPPTTSKTL
jgi:hypothetical protein